MVRRAGDKNNKIFTDDLGCEWFQYVGSNIATTREFCEHLTAKEYIHKSEIPKILQGEIDDHQCEIYEKTGLPKGLIDGTTAENFQVNVGGWNCRHQLVPVAKEAVPKEIRAKVEKKKETGKFADIADKLQNAEKPNPSLIDRNLYFAPQPTSPIIVQTIKKIKDKREKKAFFNEILNDSRASVLNETEKAKTTLYPTNKGKKSSSWKQTKQMAFDLNKKGISVSFLPELDDKPSADAIVQFKKQWVVADFKYSTSTNHNTIAKELEKGFRQAETIVLKLQNGDKDTFDNVVSYLNRNNVKIGNIVLINEYGKIKELSSVRLKNGKYSNDIKGFL